MAQPLRSLQIDLDRVVDKVKVIYQHIVALRSDSLGVELSSLLDEVSDLLLQLTLAPDTAGDNLAACALDLVNETAVARPGVVRALQKDLQDLVVLCCCRWVAATDKEGLRARFALAFGREITTERLNSNLFNARFQLFFFGETNTPRPQQHPRNMETEQRLRRRLRT